MHFTIHTRINAHIQYIAQTILKTYTYIHTYIHIYTHNQTHDPTHDPGQVFPPNSGNYSFHCHFSPTNFGVARIYSQQHMLQRLYTG